MGSLKIDILEWAWGAETALHYVHVFTGPSLHTATIVAGHRRGPASPSALTDHTERVGEKLLGGCILLSNYF
jgi:hypothetical protein